MVDHLISGHRSYRKGYAQREKAFLARLSSEQQSPSAVFIGCSDSRVIPELLTATSPGELFVVRNVANVVTIGAELVTSVGAALDYAVGVLQVPHIIVCGHYGCGGVKAALAGLENLGPHTPLRKWLGGVDAAVEEVRAKGAGLDDDELLRRAVEANVLHQMERVQSYASVRNAEVELHSWVFDLFQQRLLIYDEGLDSFVPEVPASAQSSGMINPP